MPPEPRQNPPDFDDSREEWEQRTPLELEDDRWDAFLPDGGDQDPLPEPGDFWIDFDAQPNLLGFCLAIL